MIFKLRNELISEGKLSGGYHKDMEKLHNRNTAVLAYH